MKKKVASVIGCTFSKDRKKVLLIKRRDVPVWTLPGGGTEDNETIEEAITRELLEETGFQTKIRKKQIELKMSLVSAQNRAMVASENPRNSLRERLQMSRVATVYERGIGGLSLLRGK